MYSKHFVLEKDGSCFANLFPAFHLPQIWSVVSAGRKTGAVLHLPFATSDKKKTFLHTLCGTEYLVNYSEATTSHWQRVIFIWLKSEKQFLCVAIFIFSSAPFAGLWVHRSSLELQFLRNCISIVMPFLKKDERKR